MKAIVYTEYGTPDVLKLKEIAKPTPKEKELLVKIHATPVNFGDVLVRNFKAVSPREFTMPTPLWFLARMSFGFSKPNIQTPGSEFSGVVEAVGGGVTQFRVGDAVFGYRGQAMGANAEYLCVPEASAVTLKPANISFEEAAGIPYGALTALALLRKANIQPGQKVLINGASGGIGSFAVQIARYFGAEVTGVCSTPRLETVKALGADHVIDYTREDFTQNGKAYDLIFDVKNKSSFAKCKNSLTPNGCYMLASFKTGQVIQMMWTSLTSSKKVKCVLSDDKPADLVFIRELVEAGKLKSIVDRCYPLAQAADAHRYYESGAKTGSVVIVIA